MSNLHAVGIATNDLVLRHIRWSSNSRACFQGATRDIRIIDLGRATVDNEEDLAREWRLVETDGVHD